MLAVGKKAFSYQLTIGGARRGSFVIDFHCRRPIWRSFVKRIQNNVSRGIKMALDNFPCGVVAHDGYGWSAFSNLLMHLVNELTLASAGIAEQQQSFVLLSARYSQHIG